MSDNATITIYSTPTCGFCKMAKEYLSGKKIAYTEKDITGDAEAQKWVYDHTGQLAVPVLNIGDDIIVGFDRERIDTALQQHQLA